VAAAAFNGEYRGQPAKVFSQWDVAPPDAPARQWAESRQHRPSQE